jgi:hypothetical protein
LHLYAHPFPKAGHWKKSASGKKAEKFSLSAAYTGESEVKLRLRTEADTGNSKNAAVKALQEQLVSDPNRVVVSPRLSSTDKRITSTYANMTEKGQWIHNGLSCASRGWLDIHVAPANVSRARGLWTP